MVGTLAAKKTSKEAWETGKTMRLGVARVKKATAQRLRREFAQIQFKHGEGLEAFGMRINTLANSLRILGDDVEEVTVVERFLQVVPSKYTQVAISIETLLDTSLLTVEELIGRLRAAEDRYGLGQNNGNDSQLLLTEEQWKARSKEQGQSSGGSSNDGKNRKGKKKDKPRGDGGGRTPAGDRDMSTIKCYNCNKFAGHYSLDCPELRRERKEKANLAR
jgi:hypothetical protein